MRRAVVVCLLAAVSCGGIVDPSPVSTPIAVPPGMVSVPWKVAREDPDRLILIVMNGGCHRFAEARAAEAVTHIQIVALARDSSGPGVACTKDLRFDFTAVELEDAVGTRPLVHAPVLEEWADERLADSWPDEGLALARAGELYPRN